MYSQIYRPKKLDKLSYNKDITEKLKYLGLQNFIIYGCAGSGKLTRVYCYLAEIFGDGIYNNQLHTYNLNKSIEILYKTSNYHIEICPGNYGTKDKDIITDFIKGLSDTHNLITHGVKIFLIKDADKLSYKAQASMRNLIEKTSLTARYIFTCKDLNRIIEPLKSRFYILRNALPDNNDVTRILKELAIETNLKTSTRAINIIIQNSLKMTKMIDLSYIINLFQMSYITGKYIKYDINFTQNLDELIRLIEEKFSVNNMNNIRNIIYNIYISNINMTIIIKYIVNYFINKIDILEFKYKILNDAAYYQLLMCKGNKEPLYLEGLILNIIKNLEDID